MKGQKTKRKQDSNIGNAKKHKRCSKNRENISNNPINRMEEAFLRFPHLPEQIFKKVDNKSLTSSRVVAASWANFIDEREYPWSRFKYVIADLKKDCDDDESVFHLTCRQGYARIAEMIVKNSAELNIDLNHKDIIGFTAFEEACWNGHSEIAEMIMKNSAEFNIDLDATFLKFLDRNYIVSH